MFIINLPNFFSQILLLQGHESPEHVHTEVWGWGWANERGGGVPVARSSLLIIDNVKERVSHFGLKQMYLYFNTNKLSSR